MKSRARTLCGFDTEDDGAGHPFLWCFVHARGSWHTIHQAEALSWVERFALAEWARGRVLELWATNLEYDMVNLFPSDRVAEVSFRFGRTALCGARWKRADFRDTLRHLPLSVAALGELVGLKKKEGALFQGVPSRRTFRRYLMRCERDAAITYRAAVLFDRSYRKLKERPRMTLASTALAVWRRGWDREVVRPDPEVWRAALEAYHGGRTQAFAVGRFQNVTGIDVASMFPWAMTCAPLPLPWGLVRRVKTDAPVLPHGLYHVRVDCRAEWPQLPYRSEEGTIYPQGRWRAWYVGEEILAASDTRVRVLEGFEFLEQVRPFDHYVRAMFRRKARARGGLRMLYKLLLNALAGKFGQQGHQVKAISLAKLQAMRDPPLEWRAWNGLAIYSVEQQPPPWGNNVWPAWITARARVKLAGELARLRGLKRRPLYCDTDSVLFAGDPLRFPAQANRPGDFERRGHYRNVVVVGKKEYALDLGRGRWEFHAKGVPSSERERYLVTGEAEFSRPTRLREGSRTGAPVNVWRRVRKVRRVDLKSRADRVTGALSVPQVAD